MHFPKDFVWGTATSAFQIEGGPDIGGKGPSIWDAFCMIPGKTYQGHTGDLACDHFHRFREDISIMKDMGLPAYRFSISWPRIMPTGYGKVNQIGIDFYNQLIDTLLDHGINPWVTLYHWDLPLALQMEKDGWLNPEIADYFREYADVCFASFGDRVKNWITINEPWVVAMLGYGQGVFAPGRISNSEPYLAAHHLILAHAQAVQCYRQKHQSLQKGQIGITNNCDWREPLTAEDQDKEAAERALEFFLGWFADPIYLGDYPNTMKERVADRLPVFTDEEKAIVKDSSDFFGLNHYTTMYASAASDSKMQGSVYGNGGLTEDQEVQLSLDQNWKLTDMQWAIVPWGCRKLLHWIDKRYDHPAIFITENGAAFRDECNDGIVDDVDRIEFYRGYLDAVRQAISEGVNVSGYFAWSFLDNFEWASGYSKRFGLHYVDFKTLQRIPKASAKWYKEVIRVNGF